MMKKEKIIVILVLIVLSTNLVAAFSIWDAIFKSEEEVNPIIPEWYGFKDWEINECRTWGGTTMASSGGSTTTNIKLSEITISLSAEKEEFKFNSSYNKTLYKVSYYIQPLTDTKYAVRLYNTENHNESLLVDKTDVTYDSPKKDYFTIETENIYDVAQLWYGSGTLTMPVITEDYIGQDCSACGDKSSSGGTSGGNGGIPW